MDNPLCKCQHQEQSKSASDGQWVFEGYCRDIAVGGTGPVRPMNSSKKTRTQNGSAAKSAAISTPIDADLARVIDAWPKLPDALKAAILAIVAH